MMTASSLINYHNHDRSLNSKITLSEIAVKVISIYILSNIFYTMFNSVD